MKLLRAFRRRYRHKNRNHRIDLFADASSGRSVLFAVETGDNHGSMGEVIPGLKAPVAVDIRNTRRSGKHYPSRPHDRLLKAMAELDDYKVQLRAKREKAL